jgi:hypothetical protein
MKKLIAMIVDRESMFEIQPSFGRSVITCLARMDGKVVGVIANNPLVYGGAMDVKAARKQTHFMEMCDTFHIPLIFLVDVPGFMVGTQAEAAATLREGMRAVYVGLQLTGADADCRDPQMLWHGRHGDHRQERPRPENRVAVGGMGLAAGRRRRRCSLSARNRGRAGSCTARAGN